MSWATSQENIMFPSALATALSGWPPPKPLPLQPPCPTFPGCLVPPPSSALTSPLSPAPSSPLTAAGLVTVGTVRQDSQRKSWEQARAAGALDPFVYARNRYGGGGGTAKTAYIRGDHTSIPEES